MCIIVYKPEGSALPTTQLLRTCWENNPHGAGFMYPLDGRVMIRKGFMGWEDFRVALAEEFGDTDVTGIPIALHMRIATHGGTSQGTCHPFPLTDDLEAMRKIRSVADVGFMHNGVLAGLPTKKGKSDTMSFMRNVIAPLSLLCSDFLYDRRAKRIIANTAQDCRFLLLDGRGSVRTFGSWTEEGGVYYSNDGFREFGWGTYPSQDYGYQESLFDEGFYSYDTGFGDDMEALGLFMQCCECPQAEWCLYAGAECMDESEARKMLLQ